MKRTSRTRDERFMRLALRLARRGKGRTSPNPAVGAVIEKGGRLIGSGWHRRSGEAHAEVNALRKAGRAARGATLYVTLEPCSTFGKTPPCTGAIIRAGVRRVVVAMSDPNPRHRGRGISLLRRRGIRVEVGLLAREARVLNEDFAKYMRTGLPFATAKAAMSLDGKIATASGDSRWISGEASRRFAHRLRFMADAVLIGRRTAERDDPLLTARHHGGPEKAPWRIILDPQATISPGRRLFAPPNASRTIVVVSRSARAGNIARLVALGARVIRCPLRRGSFSLRALWRRLGRMGIMSILIEGGGETIAGALKEGVVDRYAVFIAPKIIGGRCAPTPVEGEGSRLVSGAITLAEPSWRRIGGDLLAEGYVGGKRPGTPHHGSRP